MSGGKPLSSPIIIGGCPRSGTTLVRMMLDSHPRIACGPEFKLLQVIADQYAETRRVWASHLNEDYHVSEQTLAEAFGQQALALLEPYRKHAGKPRLAEKTPQNIFAFAALAQMLPQSPLIHVIRDGRDVVASLLRQQWVNVATGERMAYTQDASKAAELWMMALRTGRSLPDEVLSNRYYELLYERVIEDPESELKKLLSFLGEEWDESVIRFGQQQHALPQGEQRSHGDKLSRPINKNSLGRWRADLSDEDKRKVKQVAGAMLMELGYCSDLEW